MPRGLDSLHSGLERFWVRADGVTSGVPDVTSRLRFMTAVGEIAANIICHAYRPATVENKIRLRLRLYGDRIEARLTDRGTVFTGSLDSTIAPASDPADVPESGRGLAVAKAAVDELLYQRSPDGTNLWTITKNLGG